jgi:hypothetical protein
VKRPSRLEVASITSAIENQRSDSSPAVRARAANQPSTPPTESSTTARVA